MKFLIITVCFNEVTHIRETCESVVGQSCVDFEWIVVDGGSTDRTVEILEEYREKITVLISESDNGIYHAMNKGIQRAKGEYLIFLNGGDSFVDKDILQGVKDELSADLIYGDLLTSGNPPSKIRFPEALSKKDLLKKMFPHQATFIRRSLFDRFGTYDESFKIAGDYEWFVRVLSDSSVTTRHISKYVSIFRDDGISQNKAFRMLRKRENHRIRWKYYPSYRFSFKGLKEAFRFFFNK